MPAIHVVKRKQSAQEACHAISAEAKRKSVFMAMERGTKKESKIILSIVLRTN
jgi:hypothetical protein